MERPFDQFGAGRTQADFDEELRKLSPEFEGAFIDAEDTGPYDERQALMLADRFASLPSTTNEQADTRHQSYDDGQLALFGLEFDESLFAPENRSGRGFIDKCRRLGNTVLINLGCSPRF